MLGWLTIAGVVIIIIVMIVGTASIDDPALYCKLKGGVPITDAAGKLTRCDFPVNIYSH